MQINQGADVLTANGEKVGQISRIVIDPRTKRITHVVVEKGMLFTEDKVVPLDLVAATGSDRLQLRQDAGDLDELPDLIETQYFPAERRSVHSQDAPVYAPPYFWYPPVGSASAGYLGYPGYVYGTGETAQSYTTETHVNIPEDTVALKDGARVISADGEHIGNVDRVFTTPEVNRASHLLISKGLLFREKKVIPVNWILELEGDEVRLAVESSTVENLPDYEE